jgi:hypothetical protein
MFAAPGVDTCDCRCSVKTFDARWKTDSKMDQPAQRTEQGERYWNAFQTCESLLRCGGMLKSGRGLKQDC